MTRTVVHRLPAAKPKPPVPRVAPPAVSVRPTPAQSQLIGVWEDLDTKSRHRVVFRNGAPSVISVIDDDGEVFRVQRTRYASGVLRWTYYVPSTRYIVSLTTLSVQGDILWAAWSNNHGRSGRQKFRRVR